MPFDLLEATEGSAVILLFVPAGATAMLRDYAAAATSLADRIKADTGRLFIIAPQGKLVADQSELLIDPNGGFAYSLGLADWDDARGCADLRHPVGLVIDDVGKVVEVDLGGSPDLARLVDALPNRSRRTLGEAGRG